MRKRKWNIWLHVIALKPIVDIVVALVLSDMSATSRDYDSLSSFMTISIVLGVILFLVGCVGTIGRIRRVFKDGDFSINYKFWTIGLTALLTAVVFVTKGLIFDLAQYGIDQLSVEAAGGEVTGHGVPAFTIVYGLVSLIYVVVGTIAGIIAQVTYSSKR